MPEALAIWTGASLRGVSSEALLVARKTVNADPGVAHLYMKAVEEAWPTGKLAVELQKALEPLMDPAQVPGVARLLAEEFAVMDRTQLLLVSAETGLPLAQVPPEGLDPNKPGRLKPEVEAALAVHQQDSVREIRDLEELGARLKSTALLKVNGDNRLLVGSKHGRANLLGRVKQSLLHERDVTVLEAFRFQESTPEGCDRFAEVEVVAFIRHNLGDLRTRNLRHDTYQHLLDLVRAQWVRQAALVVGETCHRSGDLERLDGEVVLIAPPGVSESVPVYGVQSFVVKRSAPVAIVLQGETLRCVARDASGMWEIRASGKVSVSWSTSAVRAVKTELVESGVAAEVV